MIVLKRFPTPFLDIWVILIVSAYFYKEMNCCFALVRVTSSWLRMGSVAVDSFEWVVEDGLRGLRWLWEVLVGLIF